MELGEQAAREVIANHPALGMTIFTPRIERIVADQQPRLKMRAKRFSGTHLRKVNNKRHRLHGHGHGSSEEGEREHKQKSIIPTTRQSKRKGGLKRARNIKQRRRAD